MDEISKLAKELIEVKKIAEASKRRNETDTWTEIGLFLDGVDDKIKSKLIYLFQIYEVDHYDFTKVLPKQSNMFPSTLEN